MNGLNNKYNDRDFDNLIDEDDANPSLNVPNPAPRVEMPGKLWGPSQLIKMDDQLQ